MQLLNTMLFSKTLGRTEGQKYEGNIDSTGREITGGYETLTIRSDPLKTVWLSLPGGAGRAHVGPWHAWVVTCGQFGSSAEVPVVGSVRDLDNLVHCWYLLATVGAPCPMEGWMTECGWNGINPPITYWKNHSNYSACWVRLAHCLIRSLHCFLADCLFFFSSVLCAGYYTEHRKCLYFYPLLNVLPKSLGLFHLACPSIIL